MFYIPLWPLEAALFVRGQGLRRSGIYSN